MVRCLIPPPPRRLVPGLTHYQRACGQRFKPQLACTAAATRTPIRRKSAAAAPAIILADDIARHQMELEGADDIGLIRPQARTLLIGVDPGITGAVAAVLLNHDTASKTVAQQLQAAAVSISDMPVTELHIHKRTRRETCPVGLTQLVRQLQAGDQSSIHAVMELPAPNALNGKQSWYGCGHAYGTCKGVLLALGVQVHTVTGRLWKSHLALNGLGKEGSRLLALDLFPQAAKLISRKKDHGRAEALLIAAWALGARNAPAEVAPEVPADDVETLVAEPAS
ncbi:hypothetical protein WJX74_007556 [Apatococcus lobatus]|uniref:Uncharacterized protein n=1 Tax=Apatococcus lobatus TaxID=904363 RepID=A0AAW1Q6D1_9CHLO